MSSRGLNGESPGLNEDLPTRALYRSFLRDYVHAFIWIHFKTAERGTIIFGFATSIALRASKPCASINLYKIVLCFLSWARTPLPTAIFFCKMFSSSSQIALIIFRLEDFSSFLRMGSGAVTMRFIKLEYRLTFSIIVMG